MDDLLTRIWEMLIGREHGPLAFRIIIQPLVATFLAVRAGLRDARAERPAYGWTVLTHPDRRGELLRAGWIDVGTLFIATITIDIIYEIIVSRWIYPGEALIVAVTLALAPYLLIRGLANRIARRWLSQSRALASPDVAAKEGTKDKPP
jgi:hypothetical protein